MSNLEYKKINGEDYISARGVFKIILITVLFPDMREIKAYNICKNKINEISKILSTRRYGKTKQEIQNEIYKIKSKDQLQEFVEKVYNKYIFQEDIMRLLEGQI